jgi:hypothetical protein
LKNIFFFSVSKLNFIITDMTFSLLTVILDCLKILLSLLRRTRTETFVVFHIPSFPEVVEFLPFFEFSQREERALGLTFADLKILD